MDDYFLPYMEPELLVRFLSGEASAQERQQVQAWIDASEENRVQFEEFSLLWHKSAEMKNANLIHTTQDWQQLKAKINFAQVKPGVKQRTLLSQFIRIAAIVIFTLGLGWLSHSIFQSGKAEKQLVVSNTIQPSSLTLPDGTKVFLNRNSTITYPENFEEQTREVALKGEAYFEVVKNSDKPFLIKTIHTTTEVLGTSFNVYENGQSIVVNVVSGKVALYESAQEEKKIMMIAGEQGQYMNGALGKTNNQNLNFLSWKTGVLTFKDTPLPQVIADLNKQYGAHLVIENPELQTCTLTSSFHQQTLNQVLEELGLVLPISLTQKGDKTLISGAGCAAAK